MTLYAPEWPQMTLNDQNPQETPNDLEWSPNDLELLHMTPNDPELLQMTPNDPK